MSDIARPPHANARSSLPARTRMGLRWPQRRLLLLLMFVVTGTVVALWMWRPAAVLASGLEPAPQVRPEPSLALQVAAASSASSSPTLSAPTTASSPTTQEFAELKAAHEKLAQHVTDADQRLDRIESDVALLKQQLEKHQVAHARARRQARSTTPQPQAAQAAQGQGTQQRPRVLGVDTWNGQPSVSVLVGNAVRFFSEGDTVANELIRRADPASQRVEFVTAAGAAVTVTSAAEEAR